MHTWFNAITCIHSVGQLLQSCGFKIVGDNIEKNVNPRYMCVDKRTQSLHYFNAYAVKDRFVPISAQGLHTKGDQKDFEPSIILPS